MTEWIDELMTESKKRIEVMLAMKEALETPGIKWH